MPPRALNGSPEQSPRPTKRAKLIVDESDQSGSSEESSEEDGGVPILKVNQEYARRFEHNKKREELHRLQEKYGKSKDNEGHESDSGSSSDSEIEDDEGMLATETLDVEIFATLRAIRSKDPRVYDQSSTFYSGFDPDAASTVKEQAKPMYLRDYHRKNLMDGIQGDGEDDTRPPTYAEEQENLKRTLVGEMHAAAAEESSSSDDERDFLVAKAREAPVSGDVAGFRAPKPTIFDVERADEDPEGYLDNFMASRGWLSTDSKNHLQPFESEDEADDELAENFEQAYNFRFENPDTANEQLRTHARDAAAKYSVRREQPSSRKKAREAKQVKKAAERQEIDAEKSRLKKLRLEELEEKVKQIKKVAGLHNKDISMEQWTHLLEGDWEDKDWDVEMAKHFGDTYYAGGKENPKKPEWDDDIDINDIVPDFSDDEEKRPELELSDVEENGPDEAQDVVSRSEDEQDAKGLESTSKKQRIQAQAEKKRQNRKERQLINQIIDKDLTLELPQSSKAPNLFRYRETSPTDYGLTALDILMADDSQLNQYAGLKKLAPFRDTEKKRKDKKKLGKKARLRLWRKETFGNADGPDPSAFSQSTAADDKPQVDDVEKVDIREGTKKKRRHKKKASAVA